MIDEAPSPCRRYASRHALPASRREGTKVRRVALPLDPGKIRHRPRRLADFVEQLEPVLAPVGGGHVHRHLFEERIDIGAQLGDRRHRAFEVLARNRLGGLFLHGVDRGRKLTLLWLKIEMRVGPAVIRAPVLLLLDAQDVGRALVSGEQARAVIGCKEFAERLDAADDEEQVVLSFALLRENGIDEIVARALIAELDFQAVVEEGKKIGSEFRAMPRATSTVDCLAALPACPPQASCICLLRWSRNALSSTMLNDPQRRSAQRIRILAARRLLVDRPESDQRVDLVGERDRDRHRIGGTRSSGPFGR